MNCITCAIMKIQGICALNRGTRCITGGAAAKKRNMTINKAHLNFRA